MDPRIVGGSSIDSTCTIWDVEVVLFLHVLANLNLGSRSNSHRSSSLLHSRPTEAEI